MPYEYHMVGAKHRMKCFAQRGSMCDASPLLDTCDKPMTMLPLLSPRLTLRAFTMADVQAFLAYRNDPDVARAEPCLPCIVMRDDHSYSLC
jgi:RimJ/RimL family protein N-acetyltransferase